MDRVSLQTLVLCLIVVTGTSVCVFASEFSKKTTVDPQQQPASLCPTLCTCSEQKNKPQQPGVSAQDLMQNDDDAADINADSRTKGKPEILKNGIRVQCQNPAILVSMKKLNLPSLLVENIVQFDLAGNSISKLSPDDFSSSTSYQMLQKLVLKNNQIEDIAAGTFSQMKNLKYLDLSNNQLVNFSVTTVEGLANLERIKLNGNPLNCDCHLSQLLTYVASRSIKLQGSCSEPAKLKDRALGRLVVEELACPAEDPVSIEIRPNTNQIVFEGDPLRLGCRLKVGLPVTIGWIHRMNNQTTVTVTGSSGPVELSSSSREAEDGTVTDSQLFVRHLLGHHGGTWTCSWGGRSASVEVTVLSLKTPTCVSQTTSSNKGRYSWPRTMANLKVSLSCQANPHLQAYRLCGATGQWEEPDVNSCFYINEVTKVLEQFAKTNLTFSRTSAMESARRLKAYLGDVGRLTDPHEAIFVTQTLHNYLEASAKHSELLPLILDIYSILIRQQPSILVDSRHGLVGLLQQAPLKTSEFEYQSASLAIEKCLLPAFKIATCAWRRISSSNRYQASCSSPINASGVLEASAKIPLIGDASPAPIEQQNVVMSLILDTNTFAVGVQLTTAVLGVTSAHLTNSINRTVPLVVTLRLDRAVGPSERLVGAKWNPYIDQWSAEQCQTASRPDEYSVTFQCCCGYGFFAAFIQEESDDQSSTTLGPYRPVQPSQLLHLLPPPVYVGSVIGILCHLTACLCYLMHADRLKMTRPTRHALVNGWLSAVLLMFAFTLGVRPAFFLGGKAGCQAAGLLLHYLTLSSLLWMVVNASSLYKHLTKLARAETESGDSSHSMEDALAAGHDSPTKPALRFYLIGWGIPLIVVGIAGAIHLEQYYSVNVCFLARTPSLGAVGLPSAILFLLVLTFHLLSWCFLRHTTRLAAIQKQITAAQQSTSAQQLQNLQSESHEVAIKSIPDKITTGYVPLLDGDGASASCPSNLATQVTETSDLGSISSDHERSALLVVHQRGQAEGALHQQHSIRSDSERPLLLVTASSAGSNDEEEEELECIPKVGDGELDDDEEEEPHHHGHSNPLMTSFTEDGDSKRLAAIGSSSNGNPSLFDAGQESITPAPAPLQHPAALAAAALIAADDSDEKSPLSQLRAQLVSLILFCLTWLSAFCVIARPLRRALPYDDELISSLCYAFFASAAGLHAVLYHLLTRQDMCSACFGGSSTTTAPSLPKEEPSPLPPPPSTQTQPLPQIQVQPPATIDETDRCTTNRLRSLDPIPDDMNVTIMDPSMVVNSFYDPRQSKTARRFFQKQKLLQMQNNLQQQQQKQYHHHHPRRPHHRHSINNVPRSIRSSHSPIAEEALLNASFKAKVSNVNIHVEMGAYDWHELQSRMSLDNNSCSWTKSGKQLMPPSSTMDRRGGRGYRVHSPSQSEIVLRVESTPPPPPPPRYSTLSSEKQKRKRHQHGTHSRAPKKSKWEQSSYQHTHPDEKHVYVFVENNDGAASPTKKETSV